MTRLDTLDPLTVFEAIKQPFEEALRHHTEHPGRETVSLDPYAMVPQESYGQLASDYNEHVERWRASGIDIRPVVASILLVNTATEANLPWYTARITRIFEPWYEWNKRWTAEEGSHEGVMVRDIEARHILDMSRWHSVREHNMAAGSHITATPNPVEGAAYVATQELATMIAHRNSARVMDAKGASNLRKIGGDEYRHYTFYLTLLRAMGEAFPDATLIGMRRQHEGDAFAMPGMTGIPDYTAHAKSIALGGLFDSITVLEAQQKTIKDAGLLQLTPVSEEGKMAYEWASGIYEETDPVWDRKHQLLEKLRQRAARQIPDGEELRPFILGETVKLVNGRYRALTAESP